MAARTEEPTSTEALTTPLERWLPRLLAVGALAALSLMGAGQYVVGTGREPFSWPLQDRLDAQFERAFPAPNALAFAAPLFVLGGLVFAACALRLAGRPQLRWKAVRESQVRLPYLLVLIATLAACLWVIIGLFSGLYHPSYRFVFPCALAFMACTLVARDAEAGVLTRVRFRWSHLVELAALAAIVGTFIGINVRDLTDWRYASIGDEGGFFNDARRVLQDENFNWFSQRAGVYGVHPVFGSVWHAINLRFFGSDLFGWKMGALTAIALTLPVFYWLLRELIGTRVAVFGTLFAGASHYLFSYAHTGYNNIFPLFPTVSALAFFVVGLKRGSPALLFVSGLLAGLGFYTFHSSRAVIVILVLALLTVGDRRFQLRAASWILPAFVLAVLPLFASDGWAVIEGTREQSFLQSEEPLVELLGYNAVRSLFGFSFSPYNGHYTAGALMDGVSVTLAYAGLVLALVAYKQFPCRLLVIWLAVALTVTGILSSYPTVSISRLHYAIPPLAALAGVALDALVSAVSATAGRRWLAPALTVTALALVAPTIFILNGRQFFLYSAGHNPTNDITVIMRELTQPPCRDQPLRSIVFAISPEPVLDGTYGFYGFEQSRPMQLAFRDVPWVYQGFASGAGAGCLIVTETGSPEAVYTMGRLAGERYRGNGEVPLVTDLSGGTKVALVTPAADQAPTPAGLADVWQTDFSRGAGLSGVIKAQERDFVRPLRHPATAALTSTEPLDQSEPVVAVRLGKSVRAYPLRFLMWHGVANDVLAGVPILVTYDPIAGAARAFERRLSGQTHEFALSGLLHRGNALLYDAETETWWQQLTGRAVIGTLAGERLRPIDARVLSWGAFAASAGASSGRADVMRAPGDDSRYQRNPYLHYDAPEAKPIFTIDPVDGRLPPLHRVVVIELAGRHVALPFPAGEPRENVAIMLTIDEVPLVLFFDATTRSELDGRTIGESRRIGSLSAFRATHGDLVRSFVPADADSGLFVDRETGTTWNTLGEAVAGPESGARLVPLPEFSTFWFSASGNFPEIELKAIAPQDVARAP